MNSIKMPVAAGLFTTLMTRLALTSQPALLLPMYLIPTLDHLFGENSASHKKIMMDSLTMVLV